MINKYIAPLDKSKNSALGSYIAVDYNIRILPGRARAYNLLKVEGHVIVLLTI